MRSRDHAALWARDTIDQRGLRHGSNPAPARITRIKVAINRREAIDPAWRALLEVVDEIYPVEIEDAERARRLVQTSRLGARDALHAAVMQRRDVEEILTFDTAFDDFPGIRRSP